MNDRRTFLKTLAAVAAAGSHAGVVEAGRGQAQQRPAGSPPTSVTGIRKSTLINMLPRGLPYAERFAMAKAAGFEAIEMQTITRPEEAAEIKEASQKTGLRIHSVMNSAHWREPMSSADPAVVNAQRAGDGGVAQERRPVGRRRRPARARRSRSRPIRIATSGPDRSARSANACCRWPRT